MCAGSLPQIKSHPKIPGTVEPGEFLHLKCEAVGKGSLSYVWQLENQTLVNETRPDLIIKGVKESDQGAYRCRVTSAFGYAKSNAAKLELSKFMLLLELQLQSMVLNMMCLPSKVASTCTVSNFHKTEVNKDMP